jgi:HEAT repeat protein
VQLTCIAILLLCSGPKPDAGLKDIPDDAFVRYLNAHDVPERSSELTSLGPKPANALMNIIQASQHPALTRARAMSALRLFPSPAVQSFVAKWVETNAKADNATDRLIVRRAAMVLGWMGGPALFDRLEQLFENSDPDTRIDAVLALSLNRGPRTIELLRKRLGAESDPRVRALIERQLTAMDAPAKPLDPPSPPKSNPFHTDF